MHNRSMIFTEEVPNGEGLGEKRPSKEGRCSDAP
jgi:hypothetical protein